MPLAEIEAALEALDPALSGELLAPAEVDPRTGLPAFTWLARARAEQEAVLEAPDERRIDAVREADPELAARLDARRRLVSTLRGRRILPGTRLVALLKSRPPRAEVELRFDHLGPDGLWTRIQLVVALPERRGLDPALRVDGDRVRVHPGLSHVLTRHAPVALCGLREHLGRTCVADVLRLSRTQVGPFWFPGIQLPAEVPEVLGQGLVLHLHQELVGHDVRTAVHADPLLPPPVERVPPGYGVVRERRFVATPPQAAALAELIAREGVPALVTEL